MKKLFFLITLVFISKSLFAQTKQVLDSLNNVLATSTQVGQTLRDTAKVMALCSLSGYEQDNPVRSLSLINKALVLTRKIQFEKGEAQCFYQLGVYFRRISD